jgi:hypothetical protein
VKRLHTTWHPQVEQDGVVTQPRRAVATISLEARGEGETEEAAIAAATEHLVELLTDPAPPAPPSPGAETITSAPRRGLRSAEKLAAKDRAEDSPSAAAAPRKKGKAGG